MVKECIRYLLPNALLLTYMYIHTFSYAVTVVLFCCFTLANFPEDVVSKLPAGFSTGVYYGWAKVDDGTVEKMVMSIGWNPYYKNKKKSMVIAILSFTSSVASLD